MFGLIAFLYYLCFLLLVGLSLFIAFKGRGTRSRLRHIFFLLALSLLVWQLTLFLEVRIALPPMQLLLGRINFAAIVFTSYLAFRFVQEVPAKGSIPRSIWLIWFLAETWLLAILTLSTPLIDAAEHVIDGRAITTYGVLFPCYLLHVLGYLVAALILAFQERRRTEDKTIRNQLLLIGAGILATGVVALSTNAFLPYVFQDFRYSDVGTLSTLFFVLAVGYATFAHQLFDLQVVLKTTMVYGLMMVFVVSAYSSVVFLITQYLTNGADKATQFAVLLIAFSFDPLRRLLEDKTDSLLFGRRRGDEHRSKRRERRRDEQT